MGTGEYRSEKLLNFVSALIAPEDGALRKIRLETPKRGLPPINIGPDEGKILDFLVKACRAQNAVEVGTLAGYSSCWIARALPEGGMLHTLEYEAKHAQLARDNIRAAGLESKITVHEGDASVILSSLVKSGPYDFCFIDADKVNYPRYLRWAIDNVRSGGIVVGDNAYLFGKLHLSAKKAKNDGPAVEAMQEFLSTMADTRFFSSCAMIPTGEGMAMAVMK
ncbi:MAG: hypothetical protein A3J74_08325 [Elusimicrobia bacterium RIFCSPHIGHO2_02_FULL_57_9]|nr:MAG: hypothetical protein A3J74_08325 [Elusimicrobia bacterium RIFCSPHIGHO2_02_FULL_57_9]